jgi:hypothetical protein
MEPSELIEKIGGRFSKELGIDLASHKSEALFAWLLAAILFGARISWKIAEKTWHCFEKHGLLTPEAITHAGWKKLVSILDEGGYARYDFKTATKLLSATENLLKRYGGNLDMLHEEASSFEELEDRLTSLAKGIGPVTAGIFLREMRGIWEKATPPPSERAIRAAKALGLLPENLQDRKEALDLLVGLCGANLFPDFEAALLRWNAKGASHSNR